MHPVTGRSGRGRYIYASKSLHLNKKNLHSAVTVRQASDTHIEKQSHFKTAIAAEPEVALIIQKHIWNYRFKFYILFFVHIVTKILSSKLLAYKRSGGFTCFTL